MKKAYNTPALQVVNISKSDTIQTSVEYVTNNVGLIFNNGSTTEARAAGRRWDEWYEGY